MKTRLGLVVFGTLLALQASSAFALTVRSSDIVDGQVMTVDLAANAVTSAKIQDGQVMNGDLGTNAVTSDKILDGAVGSADLANGAVTDAKISGVISQSKLPVGTAAGTVASGDHNHDTRYQKKYAGVVVVAKDGGDFTDPILALDSVTDASESNPYLLKIMPGVYDLGAGPLVLKPFVDVEGSGENVTLLSGANQDVLLGLVVGAANVNVRQLSISNIGRTAVYLSGVSPTFSSVSILAEGGDVFGIQVRGGSPAFEDLKVVASTAGTAWGIYDESSAARYRHVGIDITAGSSYGFQCQGCSSSLLECSIVVGGGTNATGVSAGSPAGLTLDSVVVASPANGYQTAGNGGTSTLRNVAITAGSVGISNYFFATVDVVRSSIAGGIYSFIGDSSNTNIALSQITGPLASGSTYTCFQNYSGDFSPVNCP